MKFLIFLLSLSFFVTSQVHGQTTEMPGTVKIGPKANVFKIVTIPNCPKAYSPPPGSTTTEITYETKLQNGKTDIVVKNVVNDLGSSIDINSNKVLRIKLFPNSDGDANLYLDEKDKTVLYVNYWLNPKNIIQSEKYIEFWNAVFDCTGAATLTLSQGSGHTLKEDTIAYLYTVKPGSSEINTTWYKTSDQIRVYDKPGGIVLYYLVNRYDRNAKYEYELPNRRFKSYKSSSLDLGALTIPFKYRFGFTKNGIKIPSDVAANFNVGVYAGYKLSRYKVINKSGTYINSTLMSFRAGPFINVSAQTLDSVSSTVGKVPFKTNEKQTIAVMSTGLGAMLDVKGVQIGLYLGWDFGVGTAANSWNYHKKPWLGFGVGFKVTDLFAKKE